MRAHDDGRQNFPDRELLDSMEDIKYQENVAGS